MEIRYYWNIIKQYSWLIILGLVLGAIGGLVATNYMDPVYSASTKMMVSKPQEQNLTDFSYLNNEQIAQTYMQLLKTAPVLELAQDKLGYGISTNNISSRLISGTYFVEITVQDGDPQKAADIANTLVEVLQEKNEELLASQFTSSEESLSVQIAQMEAQISEVQAQMNALTTESESQEIQELETTIADLEDEYIALQVEIKDLEDRLPENQKTATDAQNLSPKPTLTANEYSTLLEKRLRFDQVQNSLSFYRGKYLQLIENTANSSTDSTKYDQLNTSLILYQQIYSNLLSSYESVRLARLQNTPNITQVEIAIPNYKPVSPILLNNIGLAAALGLMIAGGIIFLIEYLDDTVHSPEQVETLLHVPVIGFISQIPKDMSPMMHAYHQPRSPISEAFRTLRTNIESASNNGKPIRSLLVISSEPAEGKTTVTTNLAVVFSQGGTNAVLLDADLRKPTIHKSFDLPNRFGLSDILSSDSERPNANEVIHKINKHLTVITSGGIPSQPFELLNSSSMQTLMETLTQIRELVIIDSPPLIVSDSLILAKHVDAVLIVATPGETHFKSLEYLNEQLNRIGANVIGIVFNRIPKNHNHYYYRNYYSYYSKYGSYYGDYLDTSVTEKETGKVRHHDKKQLKKEPSKEE